MEEDFLSSLATISVAVATSDVDKEIPSTNPELQERLASLSPNRIPPPKKRTRRIAKEVESPQQELPPRRSQARTPKEKEIPQIQSPLKEAPKKKQCTCKNSKCLKLYCDCFASQTFCDNCNCVDCHNTPEHTDEVVKARMNTLERNPTAFQPKIETSSQTDGKHTKGCNCRRSGCLKRYCECFQADIMCSELCRCSDCKNYAGSEERRSLIENEMARSTRSPAKRAKHGRDDFKPKNSLTEVARRRLNLVFSNEIADKLCQVMMVVSKDVQQSFQQEEEEEEIDNGNHDDDISTLENSQTDKLNQEKSINPSLVCNENISPQKESGGAPSPRLKLTECFIAQEQAVLKEFSNFLKRTVDMLQKSDPRSFEIGTPTSNTTTTTTTTTTPFIPRSPQHTMSSTTSTTISQKPAKRSLSFTTMPQIFNQTSSSSSNKLSSSSNGLLSSNEELNKES